MFALAIAGMVVLAATEPVLPALMKPLIEGTFIDKDPEVIRWIPVVIVALYIVRGGLAKGVAEIDRQDPNAPERVRRLDLTSEGVQA